LLFTIYQGPTYVYETFVKPFVAQHENVDFEFVDLDGIHCPKENQLDLIYVKNVLVASGFTEYKAFSLFAK